MESADVSEADIDLYLGWHEKVLLKNMQDAAALAFPRLVPVWGV